MTSKCHKHLSAASSRLMNLYTSGHRCHYWSIGMACSCSGASRIPIRDLHISAAACANLQVAVTALAATPGVQMHMVRGGEGEHRRTMPALLKAGIRLLAHRSSILPLNNAVPQCNARSTHSASDTTGPAVAPEYNPHTARIHSSLPSMGIIVLRSHGSRLVR